MLSPGDASDRGRPRDRGLGGAIATLGSPRSPASSTRRSSSCTRATTATRRSSGRVGSWWWGPATRAPTSRSTSSGSHPTWLSGPDRGHVPVNIDRWVARNVAFRIIRFVGHPRADDPHADGTQGEGEGGIQRATCWSASSRSRSWRPGSSASGEDRRRHGRHADARGRPGARRRERDLVHRLPSRLLVDRPPDLRRGRRAGARARRRDVASPGCTSSACSSSTRPLRASSRVSPRDARYVVERLLERERTGAAPETVAA